MRKRLPIVIVLLVVVAAVAGYAWWSTQGEETVNGALTGSGTVEADEVQVASLVSGRITSVEVAEGDEVNTGDPLLTIDAAVLQQQAAAAAAQVRAAEALLEQARDDGTDAEVDAAKARVDAANAQLRAIQVQVGYASVSAPATGTVVTLAAEAGENAAAGRALATIADLATLRVSVYVPETRIGEVSLGDTANVTTDSSTQSFDGRVVFIASESEFTPSNVETKEQRVKLVYEVRLEVTGGSGILKPGMPVDVTFDE